MAELADDIDYERDVLKFKELWNDIKHARKTNLQTIAEKPQKSKKRTSQSAKAKKEPKKTTIVS